MTEVRQIYVARAESLGGRAVRRMLTRQGLCCRDWEQEAGSQAPAWLFLPLIGKLAPEEEWTAEARLAWAEQALARMGTRTGAVLLLAEPEPALLALAVSRGAAVACACPGELYGAERPEDPAGPAEDLLDFFAGAAEQGRRSVTLPCREDAPCRLLYTEELAFAALARLWQGGAQPALVRGWQTDYGSLARAAAAAAGFKGKLRFGRKLWQPARPAPAASTCPARLSLSAALAFQQWLRERGGRLLLSACVIMRDNEEDIGRCLASLSGADELIVVDTGSCDRSVEIAEQYTDKVFHFPWGDDFAAAKNFALEQARGDWVVFLDSDESFTPETAPGLKRLCEDYCDPEGPDVLVLRLCNIDLQGQLLGDGSEGAVQRLGRRGLRYEGAVHESLKWPDGHAISPVTVPRERALLLHTGYAPERLQAKLDRNTRILEAELAAGLKVELATYYRARDAFRWQQWERARDLAARACREQDLPYNMRFETYRYWYRSCQALEDEAGQLEARAAMRRDMPSMPDSWALEGTELWNAGREEEAVPLLRKALELTHSFLEHNPAEINELARDAGAIARALAGYYRQRGEPEQARACLAMSAEQKNFLD